MTATRTEARDSITQLVIDAWDEGTYPLYYDDRSGDTPDENTAWARLTIQHNLAPQNPLSNANGQRRYNRSGIITLQIFTPINDGLELNDILVAVGESIFEGKETSNHVWFRSTRANEIGPSGPWYQTNVITEFSYEEIK